MTPKEKAIELVNSFKPYKDEPGDEIMCALIAVNLAIEVETNIFKGKVNKSFWQEVKQEIEKL
jgi:hypothetical protein